MYNILIWTLEKYHSICLKSNKPMITLVGICVAGVWRSRFCVITPFGKIPFHEKKFTQIKELEINKYFTAKLSLSAVCGEHNQVPTSWASPPQLLDTGKRWTGPYGCQSIRYIDSDIIILWFIKSNVISPLNKIVPIKSVLCVSYMSLTYKCHIQSW